MFHLLVVECWEVLFLIFFFPVGIYIFTLYVQGDFLLSSLDPKLVLFTVITKVQGETYFAGCNFWFIVN